MLSVNNSIMRNVKTVFFKTLSLNLIFGRRYTKHKVIRRAVRVLNPDGKEINSDFNLLQRPSEPPLIQTENVNAVTVKKGPMNKLLVPPYEKLTKNDARFTKLLVMMKNPKHRQKSEKIMLEGVRLINDAIAAGLTLKNLFFSKEETLAAIKLKTLEGVAVQKVFYRTLSLWSSLTTCPGIIGVFKKPTIEDMKILTEPAIPVTVICDNIRDPGNLGSIIRNAASAGCKNILLLKGCVDPWEKKVLRAGCGGHFRIPIADKIEWIHLINYMPKEGTLYIADSSTDIEVNTFIPDHVDYDEGAEANETEHRYVTVGENNQPVLTDESYDQPSELEEYGEIELPSLLYSHIAYPKKDIFLYVGGETLGVDPRILKLACEFGGRKIKIPLENEMESLNVAFAFSIVLYEIKRQLSELYITH